MTRRGAAAPSAVLLPEAGVLKARREGYGVQLLGTTICVVGAVAIDGVSDQVVVLERVCCEIRSERGMGHTGETTVASVTT